MQLQEISISSILSLKCFLNIFLFSLQNETFQKSVATLYNFPRVQSSLILRLSRNICYSTSGKFNKTGLKLAVCVCLCVCIKKKKNSLGRNGLPRWLSDKESAYNAGDTGSIPESERSTGKGNGNPLQCPCLKKIPWTEEPGRLQSRVAKESDTT